MIYMNKYRITYRFTACKARNPNNKEVRDCLSACHLQSKLSTKSLCRAKKSRTNIQLLFPSNIKGFFDDPRDTHMIKKGYSR